MGESNLERNIYLTKYNIRYFSLPCTDSCLPPYALLFFATVNRIKRGFYNTIIRFLSLSYRSHIYTLLYIKGMKER